MALLLNIRVFLTNVNNYSDKIIVQRGDGFLFELNFFSINRGDLVSGKAYLPV